MEQVMAQEQQIQQMLAQQQAQQPQMPQETGMPLPPEIASEEPVATAEGQLVPPPNQPPTMGASPSQVQAAMASVQ
jgi:hypothetical protein